MTARTRHIRRSKRTTRPRATSFSAHLLFNCAGQLMASSIRRPGNNMCSTVKSTPELDMLIVFPSPVSSLLRLFKTRYRTSRSIGKRSEWRRSACALSFEFTGLLRMSRAHLLPSTLRVCLFGNVSAIGYEAHFGTVHGYRETHPSFLAALSFFNA